MFILHENTTTGGPASFMQQVMHYIFTCLELAKLDKYKKESSTNTTLVAGAWTERQKMYHGGSFLKLADDNMDIQNPEAQNRELSGF